MEHHFLEEYSHSSAPEVFLAAASQRTERIRLAHGIIQLLLNQAGNNTYEDICSSLELFARAVMPEFQGREPEHQAWKQAVLSGEIELEEVDTSAHAFARPNLRSEPASAGG